MSNVFQAISLPVKGETTTLGPAVVDAKWPAKACSTGKMMRSISLTDSSGTIAITLFGAAATWPIESGMSVVIKGSLRRGEYKGQPQLAGEKGLTCEINGEVVQPTGQAGAAPQAAAPAQAPTPPAPTGKLSIAELAGSIAMFLEEFRESLSNTQISTDTQEKILANAASLPALYWFGDESKALKLEDQVRVVDDAGNDVPF